MPRQSISPAGHAAPRGAYSPGVRIEIPGASLLFVTGQLARDPDGQVVAPNDITAQTEYVFQLTRDVLQAAGMDLANIVRVQTFLTNMEDFHLFRAVRDRWLGEIKPASTLIEVKGLAHAGCVVEIEVTAVKEQA